MFSIFAKYSAVRYATRVLIMIDMVTVTLLKIIYKNSI